MVEQKYSVGVADNNHSFSVRFPKRATKSNKSEVISASIAFLERGLPTKLHLSLAKALADHLGDDLFNEAYDNKNLLLVSNDQDWNGIIKGGSKTNPALEFWKSHLSSIKYKHFSLSSVFFPEINFGDLITDFTTQNVSEAQQVDFYSPVLDMVIEVDGQQHKKEDQTARDTARDKTLAVHKIKCERISVSSIVEKSNEFKVTLKILEEASKKSKVFNKIATVNSHPNLIKIISAVRFQRVILELIKRGFLPLNPSKWNFDITTTEFDDISIFKLAAVDLIGFLNVFSRIFEKKTYPESGLGNMFNTSESSLKIDFSACSVFDAKPLDEDTIYVRNNPLIFKYLKGSKALSDYSSAHPDFGRDIDFSKSTKESFQDLLKFCLGFDAFRNGQYEIIEGALKKDTMLGLLPTGGGKSLTFQFPSLIQNGCTVVVCPISALVRDHVMELRHLGFDRRAEFINAQVVGEKRQHIHRKLKQGRLQFLFVSPEQFQKHEFRDFVYSACTDGLINRFVIDEAHCLSEWGHDFRISYLTLARTLSKVGKNIPILCLTATASINVMRDLQIEFSIKDENVIYTMNQSRPELDFQVQITSDKDAQLNQFLKKKIENDNISNKSAALIFFPTVNGKSGAFQKLKIIRSALKGEVVGLFTGNAPKDWSLSVEKNYFEEFAPLETSYKPKEVTSDPFELYKERVQNLFKSNKLAAIAATKSFGMGVNKPNIRTTIHYGLPGSIEALYQEAGRAGRDGNRAECISLVNLSNKIDNVVSDLNSRYEDLNAWQSDKKIIKDDLGTQIFFLLNSSEANSNEIKKCIELLNDLRTSKQSPTLVGVKGRFGFNDKKNVEKTIYRLFQLGVIEDWTVEDFFAGVFKISWRNLTAEDFRKNFYKIVRQYEANESDFENKLNEINSMDDLANVEGASELHTIISLILWNKLTFFRYRRQSLLHLCKAYKDFDQRNPEKFKKLLDAYFQVSKNTHTLYDAITADIENVVRLVWSVFTSGNRKITKEKMDQIGGAITRFYESYPDSVALDLAYSIKEGISFENKDDLPSECQERFLRFINRINDLSSLRSELIFKELYSYLTEQKETALSRVMLETINQENFANWAMEKYDHIAPFVYLMNKLNSSMENRL